MYFFSLFFHHTLSRKFNHIPLICHKDQIRAESRFGERRRDRAEQKGSDEEKRGGEGWDETDGKAEREKESTRTEKEHIEEQSDKTRQLQHWLAHLMTRPQLWALSLPKRVGEFFSFIVATWLGSTAGLQHVSWWCVVLCGLREGDVCMAGGSGGPAETL